MNRLNNDIIREKLNSLDTLPEGYSPNLTSKWEVLEAGLGQKAEHKKPVLFWVKRIGAVAAIALFIGGSGVLLIQRPSKPVKRNTELKEVASPAKEQPALVVSKDTKPTIIPRTKAARKRPELVVQPLPVKAKEEAPVKEAFTQTQETRQETEAVATTINESVKRPLRFTEVDFNEPVITEQPPSQALVKAQRFRFKLGLAPYGNETSADTQRYRQLIVKELVDIKADGSIWMNQEYFDYAAGLSMTHDKRWEQLFGIPRREPESELTQQHCDMALAIQQITEDIVIRMATEAKRLTGAEYLCMAGGVALNCVANGRLRNTGLFKDIFIQPAAGDAGGAPGAAWAAHHLYFKEPRHFSGSLPDNMKGAALGPEYHDTVIEAFNRKSGAIATYCPHHNELLETVAGYLSQGAVTGWFQGRMEFGPRALGQRSILANPAHPGMQQTLNLKIKYRETFRPFAPIICEEKAARYFQLTGTSPYMLFVADVKETYRLPLPSHFHSLPLKEKLSIPKSPWPAVTHLNYSARVQTVQQQTHPLLHKLLQAFEAQSGVPMLVNTSFNVRGEPMVCSPEDAYRCFMNTEMDCLVMGNYIYLKQHQPVQTNSSDYIRSFKPD